MTRACSHGRLCLAVDLVSAVGHYIYMDFVPVPAGTADAVALTLRGADHDADIAANDSYSVVLGNASLARNQAGGRKRLCYSNVSGCISGNFFTRDPIVLATPLHSSVPLLTKML